MDKELVVIPVVVAIFLGIIFGAILLNAEQYLRCVEIVKEKPAAEIRLICK